MKDFDKLIAAFEEALGEDEDINFLDETLDVDEVYMKIALELAAEAEGETSPNPMVGCVITDEKGEIVAEGYHHKAGGPHAEVNALEALRKSKAKGHTAYVTLEPCSHVGKTGPCADALINAGIKRVVIAIVDPNPMVSGQGIARLETAGIEVKIGVCEKEARKLNEKFLHFITTKTPFISLKYAMTLDGKIATATHDSKYITSEDARRYSHKLRKTHDGILVGINTIIEDDSELTTRMVKGDNPVRIVLDSNCRIPFTAKVLQGGAPTLIVVGPNANADKLAMLQKLPEVEVMIAEVNELGRIDLNNLLVELGARNITSVLVEGGSAIHGAFLDANLGNRVYAFIAPKLIGGDKALSPIGGNGISLMDDCIDVDDFEIETLGKDILLTGVLERK